jgi:hypothetical protein
MLAQFAFKPTAVLPGEDELARTHMTHRRSRLFWPQRIQLLTYAPSEQFAWTLSKSGRMLKFLHLPA